MILSAKDIKKLLPHRHPFLFLDYIQTYEKNQSIIGCKCVSISDPVFEGHFPDNPIYPGVLVIESLAQTCAVMNALDTLDWTETDSIKDVQIEKIGVLGTVKVDLLKPVFPGNVLYLNCQKLRQLANTIFFEVQAYTSPDTICAKGHIIVGLVDQKFF